MSSMDCKKYHEQIVLFLYEELESHEQTDLESHLHTCSNCNALFEDQKSLHAVLSEDSGPWTVPSDLLVESRRALANELDRMESSATRRNWWRLPTFSLVFTPMRILEWTTLVAVGLAVGVYLNAAHLNPAQPAAIASTSGSESEAVSNLRIVNSDTTTGTIELAGEMVRPMHFQGNIQDEKTQQLLFGALRDGQNPSSRMNAVEVLSRKPDNHQVIDAFIRVLCEDDNPGVRLKALQSLKPFASQENVRVALMYALANDEVAGIRVQAIDALKRYATDDSVSKTVQEVTKNDDNAYVKLQAVQFVGNRQ